jgi:hypothetical protein
MSILKNIGGKMTKIITDKFGIQIKVGDFVYIDPLTGMQYGTSAGTIQQIKKIGTRRIYFDSGHKNLRTAEFHNVTAYTLIDVKRKFQDHGTFYYPEFKRTATNDQMFQSRISKYKKLADQEIANAFIKTETYRYENQLHHYQLKNHGHGFGVIWNESKGYEFYRKFSKSSIKIEYFIWGVIDGEHKSFYVPVGGLEKFMDDQKLSVFTKNQIRNLQHCQGLELEKGFTIERRYTFGNGETSKKFKINLEA